MANKYYNLVILNSGRNRTQVIKSIQSSKYAHFVKNVFKKVADNEPFYIAAGIIKDDAESYKHELKKAGAKIAVKLCKVYKVNVFQRFCPVCEAAIPELN